MSRQSRAKKLAGAALQLAIEGRMEDACAQVQRISDTHGPGGMDLAMRGWIDTLGARVGVTGAPTEVRLQFGLAETGTMHTADEVPPMVAWAGRLMAARFAMDLDTYQALINSVPRDPKVMGDHVATLLQCVAVTMTKVVQPPPAESGSRP